MSLCYTVQTNNNINNNIFTVFALQVNHTPQSVSNAAYNSNGRPSYSATGITKRATQQTWLDCFFGDVRYMSLQKLGNERLTHCDCEIVRKACIFTVKSSAPAAQRRSLVKWLTPVKPEKNACPASALFQCPRSSGLMPPTPPPPTIKPRRRRR